MSESKTTTSHEEIKKWVEKRGGRPSRVKGTEDKKGGGLLRIDYPGYIGRDSLEEISWEEFFQEFEESGLAFLYQEKTADGERAGFRSS